MADEGPPSDGPESGRSGATSAGPLSPGELLAGRWALPPWFAPALGTVLFLAYCVFLIAPIVVLLNSGWAFAGDPSEYLLTAHRGLGSGPGELPYVFPALPVLYAPLNALNLPFGQAYAVADVVSGVLVILLALAFGLLGYVIGRTRFAAAAAAASGGTFPAILGEVGWGGQAQFLAIALGVVAVALLLAEVPEVPSIRASLSAGVLLAVAAFTEPYATACFVVFGVAAILLGVGLRSVRPRALLAYLLVVLPPLVAIEVVTRLAGSSSPQGLGPAVLLYAVSTGGWGFGLAAAGFTDVWTVVGYALVLGALVAVVLVAPGIGRRAGAAVGSAVVAFLAEVFVVTPATYWPRAATFFVVPLAVATAVLVSRAPERSAETEPTRPSRWIGRLHGSPGATRWLRRTTAAVALALVVAQVVAAYGAYPGGLQFNEFESGAVGQLSWLRSAGGSVVLVAPEALTFPVAYATERPLYPAVQPFWFTTPEERDAAVFASTVAAGPAWLTAGPMELVEEGPPGYPSTPSVFVNESAYLIPLGTIVEEEGGSYAQALSAHPAGAAVERPGAPASGVSLSGEAHLPSYNVSTLSSMSANGSVLVNFTFRTVGASAASVGIGLVFPQVGMEDLHVQAGRASLVTTFQEPGATQVDLPADIAVTGNSSVGISTPTVNSTIGGPTLLWNLSPPKGAEFNASITFSLPGLSSSSVSLVTEAVALSDHDVQWVVVDAAANATALPRFELDPHFELDRASGPFDVFRVL